MKKSLEKRNSKVVRKVAMSCAIAAVMTLYLPVMAFANDPWDIANGDITVNRTSETVQQVSQGNRSENDTNPTITGTSITNGSSAANTVSITAAQNTTATVTFSDLTINTRQDPTNEGSTGAAAVTVNGEGNVSVELEGSNSLTSGSDHAGLEDHLTGTLTIKDADNDAATLTATGGLNGAGIGGGSNGNGSSITIENGTVTATGGVNGAGIGGGWGIYSSNSGVGSDITIKGGNVTATGGGNGAGIGGGRSGNGSSITIENGTVTATGGQSAAGIGGGYSGNGSSITIKNGTVIASGQSGAGIGGGPNAGAGSSITIEGGDVIAVGRLGAAGIGGGYSNGAGNDITISGSADVSVAGGLRDNGYTGAAIGNAAGSSNGQYVSGTEVAPNINGLYTTGSITKYEPGTTAEQIANGEGIQPIGDPIVGSVEPPAEPLPTPGRAIASGITADENYASTVAAPVADTDAAFFAAVDMQIDDLLKEINALIAEGRLDEAKALIEKGLAINAGTHQGFNAATLAKLGEASSMGIAVTVNFTYGGAGYSVTIPGNSQIDPAALVDENGYCGFLNLLKYFK